MATIKSEYNCGCGYKTASIVEAEKHAGNFKHNMSGLTMITVEKEKVTKYIKEEK